MKKLILSFISAGAVLAFAHASADVIILDDLSGGGAVNGRTPDTTDKPGGKWVQPYNYGYGSGVGTNPAVVGPPASPAYNYMYMQGEFQAIISVGSHGTYLEPAVLTISSDQINAGSTPESGGVGDPSRGVGLGFFDANNDTSGGAYTNFSGLVLSQSATGSYGVLTLYNDGTEETSDSVTTAYGIGGPLSYNYNVLTGTITDVFYNGHNYSSAFAGDEVETGDKYAGWTVSSANGSGTGYLFNSFEVATVPEPGTDALFALGGCLVLAGWLRLRRAKA